MKKITKILLILLLLFFIFTFFYVIVGNSVVICWVHSYNEDYVYQDYISEIAPSGDVFLLESNLYNSDCKVLKSTNEKYQGQVMKLYNKFLFGDIKFFSTMDSQTKLYIVAEVSKIENDVIFPKEIIITGHYFYQDGYEYLTLSDLTFKGKLRYILP